MTMTQPRPFKVVREFDFTTRRFRSYKVCERCGHRSQFNTRTSTPLCGDCIAALTPEQRARWAA